MAMASTSSPTEYIAPYVPADESIIPDRYLVILSDGHTFEKHCEAVGEQLDVFYQGGFYSGTLTEDQRERSRRDPGVEKVIQYIDSEWA